MSGRSYTLSQTDGTRPLIRPVPRQEHPYRRPSPVFPRANYTAASPTSYSLQLPHQILRNNLKADSDRPELGYTSPDQALFSPRRCAILLFWGRW